jgi:thiol-activated cytolysin
VLGGSGAEAAKSIDSYEGLIEFIKSGGNYSKDSPGAPIAYKLAYLEDNTPARLSLTQEYTIKECVRVSQKVMVTLSSIHVDYDGGDAGGDLELFGRIEANALDTAMLFDRASNLAVVVDDKTTWPSAGTISEGMLQVTPAPGQIIKLHAKLWDYDPTSSSDLIGDVPLEIPFETGWRREIVLRLTGSNARVDVTVKLTPI